MVRKEAYDYFVEGDLASVCREICRPYACLIRRHKFIDHAILHELFEHDVTNAWIHKKTLNLNDAHTNIRRKQLISQDWFYMQLFKDSQQFYLNYET